MESCLHRISHFLLMRTPYMLRVERRFSAPEKNENSGENTSIPHEYILHEPARTHILVLNNNNSRKSKRDKLQHMFAENILFKQQHQQWNSLKTTGKHIHIRIRSLVQAMEIHRSLTALFIYFCDLNRFMCLPYMLTATQIPTVKTFIQRRMEKKYIFSIYLCSTPRPSTTKSFLGK